MAPGDTQPGLAALVSQLADDAREVGRAELALAKARALGSVARYRTAAALFAVAASLGFAAIIAMLVGLILTVAVRTGPGLATLIVVGITMLIVVLLGLVGRAKLAGKART